MMRPVELIGVGVAAKILGRDRTMVNRYIREGKLAIVSKLDGDQGAYVLDRAVVEAFAETLPVVSA